MRFLTLIAAVATTCSVSAAEVSLHLWSGDLNVPDPVACSVDEQGRVYVVSTTRRKVGDLDIREHTQWIPDDVSFTSVEDKREFYHRELAPGKMRRPRGSLKDHNKDGSIDWKDLTVHTERIYQLRDTDGDGTADKMTVFAEGFNTEVTGIAAGVLYHDGWVYATIAPDLWRLKDTDDDGVADIREVVAHGFGLHIAYAGHDMHGPRLGPDGRIYWSIGDKGLNVTDKTGKNWYYPHEGAVMRVEPDGSGFEVFAHGLRNVQEVAFDEYGNMFGVDNDADMPGEKERFVYITERSDSGWRCNHQYMKSDSRWMRENIWMPGAVQPLFITPPLAYAGNGPAGFLYEPGTALGERLRGHFILNQFPSGKMEAFKATPKGAAFEMSKTRLINSGVMGIGMSWAPDGSFYMADWVGGYPLDEKGAIWSVDEEKAKGSPARQETRKLLTMGFGKTSVNDLQILLGHADQRVRVAAQLELAKREDWKTLAKVAGDTKASLFSRIHGVWGYGIGFRRGQTDDAALVAILKTETDAEVQSQIAKVLSDGKPGDAAKELVISLLISESPRVRFHAAIALGKLEVASAGDALRQMAEKDAEDAWLRHAVVTGLAGCVKSEDLAAQTASESKNLRVACTLALSRQRSALVAGYLEDADPAIVNEAARAIHDDIGVPEALPQLAAMLDETHVLEEPTLRRAINASLRLGEPGDAARLAKYALADKPLSLEAFKSLLLFTAPPRLDPVDGVHRLYPARDPEAVADVMQPHVQAMLTLASPDLKAAAVELMINLSLEVAAPALQQIISDSAASPALRVGALRLMASQHSAAAEFAETLKQSAAKTAPVELRMESLVQTYEHQKDRFMAEASRVLEQGTLAEKQAVMKLMAASKTKAASDLLDGWMQRLAAGKVEAGLKLDVMEAAQAHESLAERVTTYQHARTTAPRDDLVEGGDVNNGREIVTNHLGANCLACHTVEEKEGSQVGPILKTIGSLRTKENLLESLVNPVAQIAPGYGLVSVTLKDGTNLAGGLFKEDKSSITIRLADGTEKKLPRNQISMQTPPVSMMPPMLGILTAREVRDVVAYLGGLKAKKSTKK
ncbi:PVC-type heme-binding CxxCH protein [Prosthecobacter sp. SYSU 5D2]|uniref:PVC-type heme-binding CxxCH protein n=1 Tax=Prosthecobacter sp. SYSU 5D2 TaxID=3134134 RepID=UPI0031FF18A3